MELHHLCASVCSCGLHDVCVYLPSAVAFLANVMVFHVRTGGEGREG